ncbi:MAG: sulfurtransferase-like selenium metabolism protein YedF [Syntrophaceae bacterium]|nr:sulfurtransferase-like selenium metabolism protein YedF [Syntrophaceae bacterium]
MNDVEVIDCRGLACPQPVILAKKAVGQHRRVEVIVDDTVALENIRRMAKTLGCKIQTEEKGKGVFHILLAMADQDRGLQQTECPVASASGPGRTKGLLVVVFTENRMGRGNQELGYVLIKAFIHTLSEQEEVPDTIIFYNTGVLLTVRNGEVVDDLKKLEAAGTEILVCGTCTNYFDIAKDVGVGVISNMYDIANAMCQADRLVMP